MLYNQVVIIQSVVRDSVGFDKIAKYLLGLNWAVVEVCYIYTPYYMFNDIYLHKENAIKQS